MAYGASLESWLGASPHGFESHILRKHCECQRHSSAKPPVTSSSVSFGRPKAGGFLLL